MPLADVNLIRLFDTLNRFYVAQERPDIFDRLPAERGDWGAVTHMYEIGRAPDAPSEDLALDAETQARVEDVTAGAPRTPYDADAT